MAEKGVKKARGKGRPIQKGQVLNPGGRPKIPQEVKDMARAASPQAMQALISILNSDYSRPNDIIRAAEVILNRAYGTPTQSVELSNSANEQLKILVEYVNKKE
jgi:hypothetical protein